MIPGQLALLAHHFILSESTSIIFLYHIHRPQVHLLKFSSQHTHVLLLCSCQVEWHPWYLSLKMVTSSGSTWWEIGDFCVLTKSYVFCEIWGSKMVCDIQWHMPMTFLLSCGIWSVLPLLGNFQQLTKYGKCNVGEEEFKIKILAKFASIREGEGKFKYNYTINNHKSVGEEKIKIKYFS